MKRMISVGFALGNATGAELTHMPIRGEDVWRAMTSKAPVETWITKTPVGSCRTLPVQG